MAYPERWSHFPPGFYRRPARRGQAARSEPHGGPAGGMKRRGGHPGHDQGRRQSIPQVVAPRQRAVHAVTRPPPPRRPHVGGLAEPIPIDV